MIRAPRRQLLIFIVVVSASSDALAREPRRAFDPATVDARYEEAYAALERGRPAAKVWWDTWMATYAVLTAGQTVAALVVDDHGLRADFAVGAVQSAAGLVGMVVASPTTPISAASSLEAMDGSTPRAREKRLRQAERLLAKSASEEREARAWYVHLASGAVNLSGTLVLWLGYERFATGWAGLAGGIALGEVQILTAPTAAMDAWDSYRAGGSARARRTGVTLSVAPTVGGAVLVGSF